MGAKYILKAIKYSHGGVAHTGVRTRKRLIVPPDLLGGIKKIKKSEKKK